MPNFKNWKEYLNDRGTVVEKPPVAQIADYKGKMPNLPPVAPAPRFVDPKDKDAKVVTADPKSGMTIKKIKGKTNPYSAKTDKNKSHTALGELGDTESSIGVKPKKMKTEQFIDATKDMSMSEFTSYMIKECGCDMGGEGDDMDDDLPTVTAFKVGKFQPHPPEVIKYVVALAKQNPRIMENLIHELKRSDGLGDLVSSAMTHPEFYDHAADQLGGEDGDIKSRALVRAMDDKYQGFMKNQEDMYESVAPPIMSGDDEDINGADDQDPRDNAPDLDDNKDDDDNISPNDSDNENDKVGDDHDENEDGDEGEHDKDDEPKPRKLKKKFGFHHTIDAMKNFPHMEEHMKEGM